MLSPSVVSQSPPFHLFLGMDWTPDRIKALRERMGYTQDQMAKALGYNQASRVSELENGKRKLTDSVCLLLEHLDKHGDVRRREA